MTDKERLEEIKEKYSKANVIEHLNGIDIIAAAKEDIVWLIQQSKRVQKLERQVSRYKERLEVIANYINTENKLDRYREDEE